jgi:hypothetical protein
MSGKEDNKQEEGFESGKYMIRRKFYVPKKEISRDYRTFENHPSNYLYSCDFNEVDEDDES